MSSALDTKIKILMMGNPGSGKSTTENLFAQQSVFECGMGDLMNPGLGVTQAMQTWPDPDNDKALYEESPWVLIDSPGLGDVKKAKEAANAITAALTQNGSYKLVFVVGATGIRVQLDDINMVASVLTSLQGQVKDNQFAIILNKVNKSLLDVMTPVQKGMLITTITEALGNNTISDAPPCTTNKIYINAEDEALRTCPTFEEFKQKLANNEISLPLALRHFILNAPAIDIMPGLVQPVKLVDAQVKEAAQKASDEAFLTMTAKFKDKDKEFEDRMTEIACAHDNDMRDMKQKAEAMADNMQQQNQRKGAFAAMLGGVGEALDAWCH